MEQAWFKNAIFYSLDVETFYDSDGDGIGDFQGLLQKLDCIAALGVHCIWLLPFYPSSNRDNGYDVTDYYAVDTRLGTMGDFAQFLNRSEQLGLRVIIDLVVNHTSVHHPWFQDARRSPQSPFRDFYVWSDEPLPYEKTQLMFQGEEETVWTYDEEAGQYFLHRFYREQPDLNIGNPKVQAEIFKIMAFWLRLGVHGFRVDAAEKIVEPYGLRGVGKAELYSFLNHMRSYAQSQKKDAVLLAEVAAAPDEMLRFMNGNERMHMLFNFFGNQHLFLSLATARASPLENALRQLPETGSHSQWLNFLRHHDELNLRLLSKKEQQQVLEVFAPGENMRIFGNGIRRRMASMMKGKTRWLQMAYSLLFSQPGAPMIRYGDEIGMGDDLSLPGRTSVRTPMQWSPAKNGGFSVASPEKLVHPVIQKGRYGYEKVNQLSAQQQPGSLLNWIERLITSRKECPGIGCGELFILPSGNESILIHGYSWHGKTLRFVHNLADKAVQISKERLAARAEDLFVVFGDNGLNGSGKNFTVKPYGFSWLRTK